MEPLPVKPAPLRMPTPHPNWASLQADIEAHLKQTIPINEPLEVFELMHHLPLARAVGLQHAQYTKRTLLLESDKEVHQHEESMQRFVMEKIRVSWGECY